MLTRIQHALQLLGQLENYQLVNGVLLFDWLDVGVREEATLSRCHFLVNQVYHSVCKESVVSLWNALLAVSVNAPEVTLRRVSGGDPALRLVEAL